MKLNLDKKRHCDRLQQKINLFVCFDNRCPIHVIVLTIMWSSHTDCMPLHLAIPTFTTEQHQWQICDDKSIHAAFHVAVTEGDGNVGHSVKTRHSNF